MQPDVAVRACLELFQELTYAHAISLVLQRLFGGELLREEEVQVDRLLDALQDAIGTGCRGVEVVLGEVQSPATQRVVEQDRECDEDQGERNQCAAAECQAFRRHIRNPWFLKLTYAARR